MAEVPLTADYGLPGCACAMTEASFRSCPLHGENAWCQACGEPLIDHARACPLPPGSDQGADRG